MISATEVPTSACLNANAICVFCDILSSNPKNQPFLVMPRFKNRTSQMDQKTWRTSRFLNVCGWQDRLRTSELVTVFYATGHSLACRVPKRASACWYLQPPANRLEDCLWRLRIRHRFARIAELPTEKDRVCFQ